jgi:hypothetical protein
MTASRILRVVVDGAAYDCAEIYVVSDTPAVRAAIADWAARCDSCDDGLVEVSDTDPTGLISEAEFLEAAANAIAADEAELDELLERWAEAR